MSSVVMRATMQMLHETGITVSCFATERLIPALEIQGLINMGSEGISADDYLRWRSRCIKRAQRVMAGETPLPADWVFTWMSVLPDSYKDKCSQKIAAMQGLQWIRLPKYNRIRVDSVEAEIDTITMKFGDVLAHAEPAHDGFYDQSDDITALQQLQNRLFEMAAFIRREIINIEMATGIAPDNLKLSEQSPLTVGGANASA